METTDRPTGNANGIRWMVAAVIGVAYLASLAAAYAWSVNHPDGQLPTWLVGVQASTLPVLLAWLAPSPVSTPTSATTQQIDRTTQQLQEQLAALVAPASPTTISWGTTLTPNQASTVGQNIVASMEDNRTTQADVDPVLEEQHAVAAQVWEPAPMAPPVEAAPPAPPGPAAVWGQ